MAAIKMKVISINPALIPFQVKLGMSATDEYYTKAEEGKCARIGTDGASQTDRICPITDVTTQVPAGMLEPNFGENCFDPANPEYFGNPEPYLNLLDIGVPLWISTTGVATGYTPGTLKRIYLTNNNEFAAANTNSAVYSMGLDFGVDPDDSSSRILRVQLDFLS